MWRRYLGLLGAMPQPSLVGLIAQPPHKSLLLGRVQVEALRVLDAVESEQAEGIEGSGLAQHLQGEDRARSTRMKWRSAGDQGLPLCKRRGAEGIPLRDRTCRTSWKIGDSTGTALSE